MHSHVKGLAGAILASGLFLAASTVLAAPPQAGQNPAPATPGKPAASAAAAPATASPATALAARVQQRYQQVNNLATDYVRKSTFVATDADSERGVEGSGRLIWSRPVALRLEQEQPRKEIILANQGQVWWVRPERGRADLYPLDRFTTGLRSMMDALGGLAKVDESFVVEAPAPGEAPEGEAVQTLVLRPKEARADIKRLVLWFDSSTLLLNGFRTVSLIGDVTEYTFQHPEANVKLAADTFTYNPPPDYRVTDHRPQPSGGTQ